MLELEGSIILVGISVGAPAGVQVSPVINGPETPWGGEVSMSNNGRTIQKSNHDIVPAGRQDLVLPLPVPDAKVLVAFSGNVSAESMDDIIERDIEAYLLAKEQRSAETGRHYRRHIETFRSFLARRYGLDRALHLVALDEDRPFEHLVTESHVLEFRQYLLKDHCVVRGRLRKAIQQRGLRPGTVNDYIKPLCGLYRYLCAKKRTVFNPASPDLVDRLRTPELDEGVAPELREADLLSVLHHPANQPRTLRLRRARAILVVLYEIGAREDELSAWTRRRFRQGKDDDGNPYWYVQFIQKLSRTRYSRLSDNAMAVLFQMWDLMGFSDKEDHAAFPSIGRRNFGGPIQRGAISKDIDILFKNAGVGHLTTHSTRVGAINRLLDQGANPLEIAQIVGMSLQMVQRYARRHFERKRVGNLLSMGMDKVYSAVADIDLAGQTENVTGRRPGQAHRQRERADIINSLRNAKTKTAAAKALGRSREWLRKKMKEHEIADEEWS